MSTTPRPTSTTPLLANASSSPSNSSRPPPRRSRSSQHRRSRKGPHIQLIPAAVLCTLLALAALAIWDVSSLGKCYFRPLCRLLGDDQNDKDIVWWRNAGAYAPWRASGKEGGRRGLPKGFEINQVSIVSFGLADQTLIVLVTATQRALPYQICLQRTS